MKELKVSLAVTTLPPGYTCDGEDISPPLQVKGIDNTISKSLALIVDDPDAPGGQGFIHWLMWNMELVSIVPEAIPKEAVITFPISAVQGINSFRKTGYSGPCPPRGQDHRYYFKVYGIDIFFDIPPGSGKEALVKAMHGHVVQYGEVMVRYGH
jgi:Raf kinase inhibitor-like YbhB/YbcL family protein